MLGIKETTLDIKARTLTIVYDLSSARPSSSGRSTTLASTGGIQVAQCPSLPLHLVTGEDGKPLGKKPAEGEEGDVCPIKVSATVLLPIKNKGRIAEVRQEALEAKAEKLKEEAFLDSARRAGQRQAESLGALPQA